MANQWKDEKCENCDFTAEWYPTSICGAGKCEKVDIAQCRKNPPNVPTRVGNRFEERYPIVYKDTDACSYWREKEY